MRKIQQAMQDDDIRTARTHPAFISVTCLKCSYGKISSPLTEISVGKNQGLGNRASLLSHMNASNVLQSLRGNGEISETGPFRSTVLMWRGSMATTAMVKDDKKVIGPTDVTKTTVVYYLHGQTGQSTVWVTGTQNPGLVNVVPESRLPFVQISSIYRKPIAKGGL